MNNNRTDAALKRQWKTIYDIWKEIDNEKGCQSLPNTVRIPIRGEDFQQYVWGYKKTDAEQMEEYSAKYGPVGCPVIPRYPYPGINDTIGMLVTALTEEERAAVWIAAITADLKLELFDELRFQERYEAWVRHAYDCNDFVNNVALHCLSGKFKTWDLRTKYHVPYICRKPKKDDFFAKTYPQMQTIRKVLLLVYENMIMIEENYPAVLFTTYSNKEAPLYEPPFPWAGRYTVIK